MHLGTGTRDGATFDNGDCAESSGGGASQRSSAAEFAVAGSAARRVDRYATSKASDDSADEDRVLIERSRFGDTDAFARLVAKYQDRTIWIARGFVADLDSARDIAQEAFLRVYRSLHRYDPKHRFYTWYYRIVVHLAIDHVRRHRKLSAHRLEQVSHGRTEHRETVGRAIEHAEVSRRVECILEAVPLKYRILLVLRDLEGFTSKDISDIAGWNHATVRWRLHRARKLFRDAWEAAGLPSEV